MSQLVNADPHGKIALQGYDPVAFHIDGKPIKGNPFLCAEHREYKYFFASERNKQLFEQKPDRFLPAYGGYCAYGITLDALVPVEIDTWEIVDGRVVLQYSQEIKRKFAENSDLNFRTANENWSTMVTGANVPM